MFSGITFDGLRRFLMWPALSWFCMRGFPKIGGTLLGVTIIRIIVFGGLYWGPLILGNYHVSYVLSWE